MSLVNKTVVRISGREYTMKGYESEEYIHKVAIYVDKKIAEISKNQPGLSTSMIMVLTAINLADEVVKLQEKLSGLEVQLEETKESLKKSNSPNQSENRSFQNKRYK